MEILSQKENRISLKNRMSPQDLITLKQRDIQSLTMQLDLISPKKHRFFMKNYVLGVQYCQTDLMISDIEDYYNLLTNQVNSNTVIIVEINVFMRDYSVDLFLQNLFKFFSAFSLEFCKKMGSIMTKITKKSQKCEGKQQEQSSLQCCGCKQNIYDYRFSKLKQQLNLTHFQDKHHFFNIDNINYSELDALKRESINIFQSQLGESENTFLFKGNCISLEQYQQVLNLLGSDLHQKNTHIEKIIEYLNQTERKLINEDHFKQRESEDEMKVMEKMVKEDTVKGKLKEMIVLALRKYVQKKLEKMVDCQIQVNIKENEIIRELQRQKKAIKTKYMVLFKQKQRLVTEYDGKIKRLQLELDTSREEAKKEISKITEQGVTTAQKYIEACHLNEVYQVQIQNLTSQNTNLIANFSKQSFYQREKESRQSHSSGSRQQGSKRMKSRSRIKKSFQKEAISLAESASEQQIEEKEIDLAVLKGNDRREKRKNSMTRKISLAINPNPSQNIISSLKDTYKYGTYQKIEEKQEQQEFDDKYESQSNISQKNKDQKHKLSRFKAIMTHFNPGLLAQQLNEDFCAQKNDIFKASIEYKAQKEGNTVQQLNSSSKGQQKSSGSNEQNCINKLLRRNILQNLFESQKDDGRVQIQLNIFLQKYDKFISEITAEKTLNRTSSLKVHDINQRKNRLSTKYALSKPSITSKSIEDVTNNDNSLQKLNSKQQSKSSKRFRLQKIGRKSQKELKKVTKPKNQFYFAQTYSRTADNTQRSSLMNKTLINIIPSTVTNSLSHSRIDISPIYTPSLLTQEEIMNLFLNIKNIDNFSQEVDKQQIDPLAPMESQILMKVYAQMAFLHLKNVKKYEQLKKIIFYPKEILQKKQIINKKQSINHLKASLQYLAKIHRFCLKPKGSQQCLHLTSFLQKLISLSSTPE